MRRASLVHCADISAGRFKLLQSRRQLPFRVENREQVSKWGNFSMGDAFRLRLMLDLVGDGRGTAVGGLGPATAAALVAALRFDVSLLEMDDLCDVWAGVAASIAGGPSGRRSLSLRVFTGALQNLGPWVDAQPEGSRAVRIFIANASRAARFVHQRARDLGLPEATSIGGRR